MEVTLLYFFFFYVPTASYRSRSSSSGGLDVLLGVYNARVCFWLVVLYCFFLMAHMVAEKVFVYHYSRIGRMRAMVVVLPLTTDDQHLTE